MQANIARVAGGLPEEFFLQGDREKGLKLDPGFLMDRDKRLGSAFSLGCLVAG